MNRQVMLGEPGFFAARPGLVVPKADDGSGAALVEPAILIW
jgi:hypothetical protein